MDLIAVIAASAIASLAIFYIIRYYWTRSVDQLVEVDIGQAKTPAIVKLRRWMMKPPKNDYIRLSHINVKNSLPETAYGFRIAQGVSIIVGFAILPLAAINMTFIFISLVFIGMGLFYMPHYCKQIVTERELEWYKGFNLYHEIAIESETDVISSVFFRLEPTIGSLEVKEGLRTIINDIGTGNSRAIIDYPFPIVRKLEKILANLESGDSAANAALQTFYKDTYRDYKFRIVKILAQTANKAVASTLPFLMISLVVALIVPLILQFVQNI